MGRLRHAWNALLGKPIILNPDFSPLQMSVVAGPHKIVILKFQVGENEDLVAILPRDQAAELINTLLDVIDLDEGVSLQ